MMDLVEQFLIDNHEFDYNIHVKLFNDSIQLMDEDYLLNLLIINFRNNLYLCRSAFHNIELRLNSSVEIILRTIYENILRDLYLLHIWDNEEDNQDKIETIKNYMSNSSIDRVVRKELWEEWSNHFKFSIIVDQLYLNREVEFGQLMVNKWNLSKIAYSILSEKPHGHIGGSIFQIDFDKIITENDLNKNTMFLISMIYWNLGFMLILLDRKQFLPLVESSQVSLINTINRIARFLPSDLQSKCINKEDLENIGDIQKGLIQLTKNSLGLSNLDELTSRIYRIEPHNSPQNELETFCRKKEGEHISLIVENKIEMFFVDLTPNRIIIPEITDLYFVEELLKKYFDA
ncbi:MAG: hypothetical protein GPJ54_12705 [Candidatus Heimdallarchaeota archaeon]|nr:hypothetical protein [Candidatus Heimdallarchaeota archaeon]